MELFKFKNMLNKAHVYSQSLLEYQKLVGNAEFNCRMSENYFIATGKTLVSLTPLFLDHEIFFRNDIHVFMRQIEDKLIFYFSEGYVIRSIDDEMLWPLSIKTSNKLLLSKDVCFHILSFLKPRQLLKMARVNKQLYNWIILEGDTASFPIWNPFRTNFYQYHWSIDNSMKSHEVVRYLCKLNESGIDKSIDFVVDCIFPFKHVSIEKQNLKPANTRIIKACKYIINGFYSFKIMRFKHSVQLRIEGEIFIELFLLTKTDIRELIDDMLNVRKHDINLKTKYDHHIMKNFKDPKESVNKKVKIK